MSHDASAYGLWSLVIFNSAFFLMFVFSFFKPQTARDWRTFGAFAAFVVALFVEMYGFPLTIYLMSGWLQTKYPSLDLLSHDSGHLWSTLLGETGNPHFGILHIASYVFLGFGFYLLSNAWRVLYHAQRRNALAKAGPYARIRHPQYVAFVLILLGFLLQWPTLLTLLMFPILLVMYARLAVNEEAEMRQRFGAEFEAYAARTPRFLPALWRERSGIDLKACPLNPRRTQHANPQLRYHRHDLWRLHRQCAARAQQGRWRQPGRSHRQAGRCHSAR